MARQKNAVRKRTGGHWRSETKTFDFVAQNWLSEIKYFRKHSTYVKYENVYNCHIKQYLGNKKLFEITLDTCYSLLETEYFHSKGDDFKLSSSTLYSIRNVITQIMNYGDHPINISLNKNMFPTYAPNVRNHIFSKEEQQKLQKYLLCDMDNYKLGIYVCMFTGLRLGEICALKIDNIDLSKKVIKVTQTVQRIKSKCADSKTELIVSSPKTLNSNRIIPICDVLHTVLNKHMPSAVYLVNGDEPMEPRTYQYFFSKVLNSLSIEKKNFHTLRHTFATNCIDSGMDSKCLSEILGHSDVKTTLNRYVHPSFEQKFKQINSFACSYSQTSNV